MFCINSKSSDPYYNLAAEEYFLKKYDDNIFILWVSKPAVIVGKHQNTLAEINYNYVNSNEILVARRLSGGGTVYHDYGNLNFTWILNGEAGKLVDFKKFIDPIINFLKMNKINATYGGRNDILVNNLKISGNAEHIYKNRTLHHGTLLYNANLTNLREVLKIDKSKYLDKAVKSVPHPVTNLQEQTDKKPAFEKFRKELFNYILQLDNSNKQYNLSDSDKKNIKTLRKEKYINWDWIFGYSPDYKYVREIKTGKYPVKLQISVSKGIITDLILKNIKNKELKENIKSCLINVKHEEKEITGNFINSKIQSVYKDFDIISFVKQLF